MFHLKLGENKHGMDPNILPIASSFGLTVATMPLFIGYFHYKKRGQQIREEGPNGIM